MFATPKATVFSGDLIKLADEIRKNIPEVSKVFKLNQFRQLLAKSLGFKSFQTSKCSQHIFLEEAAILKLCDNSTSLNLRNELTYYYATLCQQYIAEDMMVAIDPVDREILELPIEGDSGLPNPNVYNYISVIDLSQPLAIDKYEWRSFLRELAQELDLISDWNDLEVVTNLVQSTSMSYDFNQKLSGYDYVYNQTEYFYNTVSEKNSLNILKSQLAEFLSDDIYSADPDEILDSVMDCLGYNS